MKKQFKKLILLCMLSIIFVLSLNIRTSYADALGDRLYPYSAWNKTTFNLQKWYGDKQLISLQLKEMYIGDKAWDIVYEENMFNEEPSSTKHWLLFKFHLDYISCNNPNESLEAYELIDSDVFFTPTYSSINTQDTASFTNYNGIYDVELYPSNGADFYCGILIDNSINYPLIRISNSLSESDYTWFNTNPNYIEPIIKQNQSITASDITKTYGNSAFNINAKTTGNGTLIYKSSNESIATISDTGKVTIKKAGTVDITISASETDTHKSATKTITLTINKANQTITTPANTYKKANKGSDFSLNATCNGGSKLTYTSSNSKVVTVSSTGKVSIKGCGIATITIKSASTTNYNSASKKVTVTIIPAKMSAPKLSSPKKKALKISVTKQATVSGYQYQYATNSSFTKGVASKSTSTTKNITKLVSKKTYYVRVRAYKVINGTTYYGAWSTTKKIKVK